MAPIAKRRPTSQRCPPLSRLGLALLCVLGSAASANPSGPSVVSGQATIGVAGKTLTVANSPGAIINWQTFSVAPDELTRFIQQNAHSSVLNRVTGQDPSLVLGRLQSNGRVFLLNPNGVVFGPSAQVDVGGLVVSTLGMNNADFVAGRLNFEGSPTAGTLTQLGSIRTASGGQVVLVAPQIQNSGVIMAPQGEILLAAGHSVQLVDTSAPALRVTVDAPAGQVVNLGTLVAQSGRIGISAGLIHNAGSLNADHKMEQASQQYNSLLNKLKAKLPAKEFNDLITEITSRRTGDDDDDGIMSNIVLSHHFDLKEDFACVYFPQVLKGDFDDGYGSNQSKESSEENASGANSSRRRIVPTLLTNRNEFIRLDYLKRKTPQDLLLINGKYTIEEEIEQDPFSSNEVSLTDRNVRKYLNGEYDDASLTPRQVVSDMEELIRQFFYFPPERDFWYKMLAVWIYGTYYYMMFGQYPYLLIDGVKGSGKSTIDTLVYKLAFNAKLSANSSAAALYRMINQQGGTVILDEMENLFDKRVLDSGDIGSILKSGYTDVGRVYRVNVRNDEQVTVGFRIYGPKVISNINGVDEVLESRCINLRTPRRVTAETVANFKDSKLLMNDREWSARSRDISSRATLSTLKHFKQVGEIFHDQVGLREERKEQNTVDKDETPRTSQILAPLLTIAKVCGEDFLTAFHNLYREEITKSKKQAKDDSLEGMIQNIVGDMAREFLGVPTNYIVAPNSFEERFGLNNVQYEEETGFFTFNTVHVRILLEELDPALYDEEKSKTDRGKQLNFRSLSSLLKEIFTPAGEKLRAGVKFDRTQIRPNIDFTDRYKTNNRISVTKFRVHVKDFIDDEEAEIFMSEAAPSDENDLF